MEDVKYPVYGILYENGLGKVSTAVVSGESGKDALSVLEMSLEESGHLNLRENNNLIIKNTGAIDSKRRVIFGYDSFTDRLL
jgi:hypothetical protein